MPTVKEMGKQIHVLGTGGLHGLQTLGYLPHTIRKPCLGDTIKAFETYWMATEGTLSDEEKVDMGWNMVVAEHTLCKVVRTRSLLFGK